MTLNYMMIIERCPNRTEWLVVWFPTVINFGIWSEMTLNYMMIVERYPHRTMQSTLRFPAVKSSVYSMETNQVVKQVWTNQPINSFLIGCLNPCLQNPLYGPVRPSRSSTSCVPKYIIIIIILAFLILEGNSYVGTSNPRPGKWGQSYTVKSAPHVTWCCSYTATLQNWLQFHSTMHYVCFIIWDESMGPS